MSTAPHRVCAKCRSLYRGEFARCPRDGEVLEETSRDPLLGTTLGGRYLVRLLLGEGGAGRVYEGVDQRLDRPYAIKVLFGDLSVFPDVVQRFRREAVAAARMDHPNVAAVIDHGTGEDNEPSYLVMELARGRALSSIVVADGPLSEAEVWDVLRGVTAGLSHAHARGVVHRDLKPNNVILEPGTNRPRLVDFGVARIEHSSNSQPQLTNHGMVVGTPGFIAPEVLRGATPDERSDLYGLGITVWYCLFGKLPFDGDDNDVMTQTMAGLDLSALDTLDVSSALRAAVRALLQVRSMDRPESADAFAAMIASEATPSVAPATAPIPTAPIPVAAPTLEDLPDVSDFVEELEPTAPPSYGIQPRVLIGAGALLFFGAIAFGLLVGRPAKDEGVEVIPVVEDTLRAETSTPSAGVARAQAAPPSAEAPEEKAAPPPAPKGPKPAATSAPPPRETAPARAPATPSKVAPSTPAPKKPSPKKPATAAELSAAYTKLGAQLDALEGKIGKDAVAPYRARYFDIPFADALRRPDRIPEVMAKIRALQASLRRAGR